MSKKRILFFSLIIMLFIVSIIFSINYYNDKYIIKFETGTEEKILNQYVKEGAKVIEPDAVDKDGYIFVEWQHNGEKYDFDNPVTENLILSAKWAKDEYITINYDTNSSYEIDSIQILKGSSIANLPVVYKDNYEFIGWYLNDELYSNNELNSDVTLVAHFKEKEYDYKIGDKIVIIGKYYDSCISNNSFNVAIGWEREVLNIISDTLHPYVIGDETGVTGFFDNNSIKKILY